MPRANPARRSALTDAAIALLARHGTHGLTHRAVERAAELPPGTAVNYFRTREDLLVATAERVVTRHLADMARLDRTVDVSAGEEPLVDLLTTSLLDAVGTARERYLAVVELRLEARRRPALAAALAGLEQGTLAFTAEEHTGLGLDVPPEAVPTLATLYGGVLVALVSGPDDVDPGTVRELARAIVRGAVGVPGSNRFVPRG